MHYSHVLQKRVAIKSKLVGEVLELVIWHPPHEHNLLGHLGIKLARHLIVKKPVK